MTKEFALPVYCKSHRKHKWK